MEGFAVDLDKVLDDFEESEVSGSCSTEFFPVIVLRMGTCISYYLLKMFKRFVLSMH